MPIVLVTTVLLISVLTLTMGSGRMMMVVGELLPVLIDVADCDMLVKELLASFKVDSEIAVELKVPDAMLLEQFYAI